MTSFDFLSLKSYVYVPSKSNKQKNCWKNISFLQFLCASWRLMTKIEWSWSISLQHWLEEVWPHFPPPPPRPSPPVWDFGIQTVSSAHCTLVHSILRFKMFFVWDRQVEMKRFLNGHPSKTVSLSQSCTSRDDDVTPATAASLEESESGPASLCSTPQEL